MQIRRSCDLFFVVIKTTTASRDSLPSGREGFRCSARRRQRLCAAGAASRQPVGVPAYRPSEAWDWCEPKVSWSDIIKM